MTPAQSAAGGSLRSFTYTTPQGTRVQLQVVGRGSLEGTTVDQNGALHLRFSKTNSYSKIVSTVHGGTGQADLASVVSLDLAKAGATNSLSGIGGSVIQTINLMNFNLIPGGRINVTEGIGTLGLNSMGPGTQIQLRELPSSVTAGQTTTTTGAGVNNTFVTGAFQVQGLANIDGEFISAGTILNISDPTNPGPPPAPPGVILRINHINGNVNPVPDLLTDARIYGYNQTTGQVVRFKLDLNKITLTAKQQVEENKQAGQLDETFTPIQVLPPGTDAPVSLSVGRDGNRLVLLVATETLISVYDATYGTFLGDFAPPPGFQVGAMGSTDTLTVLGDTRAAVNQLQSIDVAASLASPTNQAVTLASYNPPAGVGLVGGLTGLPGSNRAYATIAATFNSFTPTQTQLGLLTASATQAVPDPNTGQVLINRFRTDSVKAIQTFGGYIPVDPAANPDLIGVPVGAVDANLAINNLAATSSNPPPYPNVVTLVGPVSLGFKGTVVLNTSDTITDLSETFRPDLNATGGPGTGPALIDVQGNIQSLRGLSANGLVLNNTGYLNLIRTGRISNSYILAQPIGHVLTSPANRTNVTLVSSANRDTGARGGVTLVRGLQQIGPLSLTNDVPPSGG